MIILERERSHVKQEDDGGDKRKKKIQQMTEVRPTRCKLWVSGTDLSLIGYPLWSTYAWLCHHRSNMLSLNKYRHTIWFSKYVIRSWLEKKLTIYNSMSSLDIRFSVIHHVKGGKLGNVRLTNHETIRPSLIVYFILYFKIE